MSDSIIDANYEIIQERTLPVIASEIKQIERTVYSVAMDGAIQIGEKLKEAQGKVPAGEWVKWLGENLNYSQRQAYNFMEIASNYGDSNSPYYNLQTSANLSISKALELLRLPDEEVETFTETHDIESETVKSLRQEINDLKAKASSSVSDEEVERLREHEQELEKSVKDTLDRESDLQAQLDAAKEKLRKAKDKLKEANAAKDEEVRKAIEEGRADIEKKAYEDAAAKVEATLGQNAEDIIRLQDEVDRLEKKLANNSDKLKMSFKIYMDELQDTYFKINEIITEQNQIDEETGSKMQAVLQKIVGEWRP